MEIRVRCRFVLALSPRRALVLAAGFLMIHAAAGVAAAASDEPGARLNRNSVAARGKQTALLADEAEDALKLRATDSGDAPRERE